MNNSNNSNNSNNIYETVFGIHLKSIKHSEMVQKFLFKQGILWSEKVRKYYEDGSYKPLFVNSITGKFSSVFIIFTSNWCITQTVDKNWLRASHALKYELNLITYKSTVKTLHEIIKYKNKGL